MLRLYIAGAAPHSTQALENIRALCSEHVDDDYDLEIVDVLRDPRRALNDGILVTPTLVKVAPEPVGTLVGDLSATTVVLRTLGLPMRRGRE